MHNHISLILLLYAFSATPNGGIVDVEHLCDLYEAQTRHVVVQGFSFCNTQTHLVDNRINLGVVLDLVLSFKVNGGICGRAFFNADGAGYVQILLLDISQGNITNLGTKQ